MGWTQAAAHPARMLDPPGPDQRNKGWDLLAVLAKPPGLLVLFWGGTSKRTKRRPAGRPQESQEGSPRPPVPTSAPGARHRRKLAGVLPLTHHAPVRGHRQGQAGPRHPPRRPKLPESQASGRFYLRSVRAHQRRSGGSPPVFLQPPRAGPRPKVGSSRKHPSPVLSASSSKAAAESDRFLPPPRACASPACPVRPLSAAAGTLAAGRFGVRCRL
nr:uncharacterized protein LOC117864619 [Setaria viridis]